MALPKAVTAFLTRHSWHLVEHIDLGTTAHALVIERDGERWALKVRREESANTGTLLAEYRVLHYLGNTEMRRYVPKVGEWLPELSGFLMEYLHYPTQVEKSAEGWVLNLAGALRTLHDVELPEIKGIADDRPDIGAAMVNRFHDVFEVVQRKGAFWNRLPEKDWPKLEWVRAHYESCLDLLLQARDALAHAKSALTHGDLAGDNLILGQDGRLVIADWGEARISAPLADVANLLVYADWSEEQECQFLNAYGPLSLEREGLALQLLSRLYCYRSCVQSLLWLNEEGEEGLDAVGRAHLERMLGAL